MVRLLEIAVFISMVLELAGCNAPQKNKPVWEQAKIGDLAPAHILKQPDEQLLKTINFKVYIFEVPSENISELDSIWQSLQSYNPAKSRKTGYIQAQRLQFDNYEAFTANSFTAATGQIQEQNNIFRLLRTAQSKTAETVSLLLFDGQSQNVDIARLSNEQTVFYATAKGKTEGVTIGPGMLNLQIKVEKIPGLKNICNVSFQPIFVPPKISPILQLAEHGKTKEFPFTCCRFKSRMSPGEFIFLGPEKYTDHQTTLDALFFNAGERRPKIRTFLLLCTNIND